jgi:hypothetical protein
LHLVTFILILILYRMNLKNLTMWGIIVLLVLGLFNLFQNPATMSGSKDLPFSTFMSEMDKGNITSAGFDVGHEALRSMPRSQPPCKKAEKR